MNRETTPGTDGKAAHIAARGIALFLGGFTLLNLLAGLFVPGDLNIWWIDPRPFPRLLRDLLLVLGGPALLGFGLFPDMSRLRRGLTGGLVILMILILVANTIGFFALLSLDAVEAGFPVPISGLMILGLLVVYHGLGSPRNATRSRLTTGLAIAAVLLVLTAAFPLAQMFCFGKTDYRRPADLAVILGAGVFKNGNPSQALYDRVMTGCELYREGLTPRLVMSGGPGPGRFHETEVMKRLALEAGVPEQAIILDDGGINTWATVENTSALARRLGARRVLVVSHFYHLPRIKLTYRRAGFEVLTVPAYEPRYLLKLPWYLTREVVALWAYYLRALVDEP